jgi:hypothetical protein
MEMMTDFDAEQFFDIGRKIANKYANEGGYRTAIGRVYYACHLIGSDATKQKGWFAPRNRAEDHSGLCRALKDHNQTQIENKLRDLIELREHADYHIKKPSNGGCQYCKSVVDKKVWERAESIASNILPKLKAIYPKQSK